MFADVFNTHYDSHHPEYSHTLVNSVRSDINSKLDHEKKTLEFITELRRKLYFIHEYNCQVAKATHKYPRSKMFDLLLIKYVELEFDVLYNNSRRPPKQVELKVELRVLHLLQLMLYPTVLNHESLVNKNTDRALKKAVLELLGQVRTIYLVKNKLICNITNKLLKKVDGKFNFNSPLCRDVSSLATSDYGTDDSDSDAETKLSLPGNYTDNEETSTTLDCVEIPLTHNGVAAIPTIEFVDDNDDNYFIYLEKQKTNKRKSEDSQTIYKKQKQPVCGSNNKEPLLNESLNFEEQHIKGDRHFDTKNYNSNCHSNESRCLPKSNNAPCIILCSDSEEETENVDKTSNKKYPGRRTSDCRERKKTSKNIGVVTFEILDDEDSDGGHTNYMVYMQKEVKANKQLKKPKEIIICSDSEEEGSVNFTIANTAATKAVTTNPQKTNNNRTVPLVDAQRATTDNNFSNVDVQNITKQKQFGASPVNDFVGEVIQSGSHKQKEECQLTVKSNHLFLSGDIQDNVGELQIPTLQGVEDTVTNKISNSKVVDKETNTKGPVTASASAYASPTLNNDVTTTLCGNNSKKNLVDPSIIFEQITQFTFDKNEEQTDVDISSGGEEEFSLSPVRGLQETSILGDLESCEKLNCLEAAENAQECRINDTLLEEFLMDDSYLLEGRKEFEELEYFLFNDSADKKEFYMSNFSCDDNDAVLQPETFDADIKSLESFLDDSQLISLTDCKSNSSRNSFDDPFQNTQVSELVACKNINVDYLASNTPVLQNSKRRTNSSSCRREKKIQTPEHLRTMEKR